MNMFQTKHTVLLALCFWAIAPFAAAQTPARQARNPQVAPTVMSLKSPNRPSSTGLSLDIAAGFGFFQDLQAPTSANATPSNRNLRVDGTVAQNDSSSQNGPLLSSRLGWAQPRAELAQPFAGLLAQRISNLATATEGSPSASYVRLAVDGGVRWSMSPTLSLLTGTEIRRSIFRNTDSGHYIDSVMLRGGAEQRWTAWVLNASVAFAPMSRFGYMQASDAGPSGTLANTKSTLYEWTALAAWRPAADADLFVSVSQENVSADMADVAAYRSLGLNVADNDDRFETSQRSYRLTTTAVTVGAVRRF